MHSVINLTFNKNNNIVLDLMDIDTMAISLNSMENVNELLTVIQQYSPYYEIKVYMDNNQQTIVPPSNRPPPRRFQRRVN